MRGDTSICELTRSKITGEMDYCLNEVAKSTRDKSICPDGFGCEEEIDEFKSYIRGKVTKLGI